MGDIANMTDSDGRVNGQRLLSWLGRRAEMASRHLAEAIEAGDPVRAARQRGKLEVLLTMANDLAAELTPPDYPEDDGNEVVEDEPEYRPCAGCGRMAPLKTVEDNGRAVDICSRCYRQWGSDTVDLDDLPGGTASMEVDRP